MRGNDEIRSFLNTFCTKLSEPHSMLFTFHRFDLLLYFDVEIRKTFFISIYSMLFFFFCLFCLKIICHIYMILCLLVCYKKFFSQYYNNYSWWRRMANADGNNIYPIRSDLRRRKNHFKNSNHESPNCSKPLTLYIFNRNRINTYIMQRESFIK